jgi:P pilus assembly chaperone PapD
MLNKIFVLFIFLLNFSLNCAFASLQVFPLKADLSQKNRSTSLSVRNKGSQATTYQISLVYYEQAFDGAMTKMSNPTKEMRSAHELIRYSPRRVSLAPGESQVVRLMVRTAKDLTPGDYRVHIRFEEIDDLSKEAQKSSVVKMELKARISISIPVIYRHGEAKGEISLDSFALQDLKKEGFFFTAVMNTTGPIFPFGVFKIFHESEDSKPFMIVRGISSYLPSRRFNFKLDKAPVKKGQYYLKFYKDEFDKEALAQAVYNWQG